MPGNKKTNILKYMVIFEEAEEGGYTVYVPSLPGCVSEGDTYEEARTNITDAISLYLEDLAQDEEETDDSASHMFVDTVEISKPPATL